MAFYHTQLLFLLVKLRKKNEKLKIKLARDAKKKRKKKEIDRG